MDNGTIALTLIGFIFVVVVVGLVLGWLANIYTFDH